MKVTIVGAGDVGMHVSRYLSERGVNILLMDIDESKIVELDDNLDVMTIKGNAMHSRILKQSRVEDTDLFVAVTGDDSVNIVAAARAKELGAKAVLARVDDPGFYEKGSHLVTGQFGINTTVCASRVLGLELLRRILEIDFSVVHSFSGYSLAIAQFKVEEGSGLIDKNLKDVDLKGAAYIAGTVRNGLFRPIDSVQKVSLSDELVIAGTFQDLASSLARLKTKTSRKAVIVGGGDVGFQIAGYLSVFEPSVDLIEKCHNICEEMASPDLGFSIIHGDGTDVELLRELNLEETDYLVAVARSDEINLMSALVAKDLGAGKVFTRLNRSGYQAIYDHLNVDHTASPHEVMLKFITAYIDAKSALRSVETNHSHTFFEVRLPYTPGISDVHLSSISLPPLVNLLGAVRKFVPIDIERDFILSPGDSLIFSGPPNTIKNTVSAIRKNWKG